MRLSFVFWIGFALAAAPALAQQPPPAPSTPRDLTPVPPADIKGEITNTVLSVKEGGNVKYGDSLAIEFDYTTTTPGKTAVAVAMIVAGKEHTSFGYTPFTMNEKSGKGVVRVSLMWASDEIVDEFRVYLWPISGGPGRRDVAAIKGPVRFAGSAILGGRAPMILTAQLDAATSDRLNLMLPVFKFVTILEEGKEVSKQVTDYMPAIKVFLRDVRGFRKDGKAIEPNELADRLKNSRPVAVFPLALPEPTHFALLNDEATLLVLPASVFERAPARPFMTPSPPPPAAAAPPGAPAPAPAPASLSPSR